jgi:hypothetical protein
MAGSAPTTPAYTKPWENPTVMSCSPQLFSYPSHAVTAASPTRATPWSGQTVGAALAGDALERFVGALAVIEADGGTVGIAEIELRQIAVEMLLRAMLVDAPIPRLKMLK